MDDSKSKFRVDFKGILDILSKHLYSSEEIFLRELLQNARDAILLRQVTVNKKIDGIVTIELVPAAEKHVLIFEDNGNGLTLEEVEKFLSVIGSSSKKQLTQRNEMNASFVGQFGIGLLSCFMVSDKITLISKSSKSLKAVKWVATIDGTYASTEIEDSKMETGTKIFLEISAEKKSAYSKDRIIKLLEKYSQFLDLKVNFIEGASREVISKNKFPWAAQTTISKEEVIEFGRTYFDINFNHGIPLKSRDGQTEGIGFIYPFPSKLGSKSVNHVYIKNMLIDEACGDLLPDWAFFLKAIVNSEKLKPTASRESIYKDETLKETQLDFEQSIREYFKALKSKSPSILEEIIATHSLAMKAFACSDDDFFKLIIDFISFPTSKGTIKVKDFKDYAHIKYVEHIDSFRQILPIAKANDQLVVNGGYIYDTTLLKKLAATSAFSISPLDDLKFESILEDISWEEENDLSNFRHNANGVLAGFKCEIMLKNYVPTSLPAIYHLDSDQALGRDIDRTKNITDDLWGGMLDEIVSNNSVYQTNSKLFLNISNPLIKKISNIEQEDLFKKCVELIYVNALLIGHYALNEKEATLLNENLISIIDLVA